MIGAGISGLAAARELQERGHEVLVVEARGRVGGRLKGERLQLKGGDSQHVDLGGALIHGIEDNPIHKITTQMGVPLHEISDYCLLLDENGWPFDPKEDEKLSALYNECLDETFRRVESDKDSKETFGALFDRVCKERGVKNNHPLMKWHQANLELPTGADFHELGYTWNDDEPYGFEGAHMAVEPSWDYVMKQMADGLDIVYDAPVKRIQVVLPDGTTPVAFEPPPSYASTVEPSKEESQETPVKIVTRTEWRNAPKPKSPILAPERQSRRIRGEDATVRRSCRATKGVIHKLTVGHDAGSFSYDDPSMKPLSSNRKRKKSGASGVNASTVHVTLKSGMSLEADAVVCTLPLGILKLPPNSSEHIQFVPPLPEAKRSAIQQLGCGLLNKCAISFSHVFWQDSEFLGLAEKEHSYLVLNAAKYTGKAILIFMYGGSFAKEVESWTDSEVVRDCLDVLRRIVGVDTPPQPVDYCVTRWGKEQYSRMSFTYIPPGVDGHLHLQAAGDAIYDPVMPDKPLIMFAGEHTTPYHPSTMHGAFLTGIREAYRYDMEFETDHMMYDFTFPTRRTYRGSRMVQNPKSNNGADAASKSSQIRSRRHRFANMALRKHPTKRVAEEDVAPTVTPTKRASYPATPDTTGSRRSSRSCSVRKVAEQMEHTSSARSPGDTTEEKQLHLDALEDRNLMRAWSSYGRDLTLTSSKVLPVYGSSRKRTADHITKRWQTFNGLKKTEPFLLKKWEATKIDPALAPETLPFG